MILIHLSSTMLMIVFGWTMISLADGIRWNNNWAFKCDFKGNDLKSVRIRGEDCGGQCASTPGCTHFTWTRWQGGTCWMKKGPVTKADAFDTQDQTMVCGVVKSKTMEDLSSSCSNPKECRSKWGYCGEGSEYCGEGCQSGPCYRHDATEIVTNERFACVFNSIGSSLRNQQFKALKTTGWQPENREEAAVFLAHVCHETDGLKAMKEYCAPGCGNVYSNSWCEIQGRPGKLYYGRGWFQLSYPCNYYRAGQSLGIDLLADPDRVEKDSVVAIKTALWFYQTNDMAKPARRGDFAATTRIINGPRECNKGVNYKSQLARVETYKRIRQCFNLGQPTTNPIC